MRAARSQTENTYVLSRLRPILDRLKADNELMSEFLAFASRRGNLDPIKFAVRLNNSTSLRRPPATFTALVLLEFAQEKGLAGAESGRARR